MNQRTLYRLVVLALRNTVPWAVAALLLASMLACVGFDIPPLTRPGHVIVNYHPEPVEGRKSKIQNRKS